MCLCHGRGASTVAVDRLLETLPEADQHTRFNANRVVAHRLASLPPISEKPAAEER